MIKAIGTKTWDKCKKAELPQKSAGLEPASTYIYKDEFADLKVFWMRTYTYVRTTIWSIYMIHPSCTGYHSG